jgi:hypothetical protein
MTRTAPIHAPAALAAGALLLLTVTAMFAPAAQAAEFFVNNASASCSPSGPGTVAAPFCTITAALAAHHAPGDIITVMPGVYREQVTVPASGVAGSPITLRAQPGGAAVVVDGTDDFSDPSRWAQSSGDVWLAASVTIAPKQVFADDQRLAPSSAAPASLPARSFAFVAGSGLYVNAGGGNPGTHRAQVGRRLRGFFTSGKSFVVIRGFTVTRCEDRCIQLTNSSNVLVDGNTLTFSGGFGFQANGDSADRVVGNRSSNHAGHGFSLINRTVETTIENNEAFDNADPNVRVANGIFVGTGSARNVIRGNRWHKNQDSGEQFSPGAADNVSIQNRSWANGDHGYDHNGATGTLHLNDVAVGNFKDGFSIEGGSTGTRVFNAIAIENGVTQNEYDLFVDSTSTAGLQSNDNVLWNSGPQPPVKIANSVYPTVSGYSAGRAQDTRSAQADPRFADVANGDFHLLAGSPAIDNANSSIGGWPSTDAEGHARVDDPGTPNTGLGPVTFADRGALEFPGQSQVANQPPVARLTAKPSSGDAPLRVHLNAGQSSDPEGAAMTFRFDFGDGTSEGPKPSPEANHIYAAGSFTATVTVTDDHGATATATATIVASGASAPPAQNLVANGSFEANTAGWTATGGASIRRAAGGHSGGFSLLASAPLLGLGAFGISDQPSTVQHTGAAGTRYHARTWVRAELGAGLVSLVVVETPSGRGSSFSFRSSAVVVGNAWTAVDLDVVTHAPRSTLDLSIVDAPSVAGTAFRIDDVSLVEGGGEPAAMTAFTETAPEPADDPMLAPGVHPNPMRADGARIVFTTGTAGPAEVAIFDLSGRIVRRLAGDPSAPAGVQFVAFDGRSADGRRLPGGVYYYQVRTQGATAHGRLVIVE